MCSITQETIMKALYTIAVLSLILAGCSADQIITPGLGSIRGVVIDEAGKPVSGVNVETYPETGKHLTGEDGSFVIPDISWDSITVYVDNEKIFGKSIVFPEANVITEVVINASVKVNMTGTTGSMHGIITSRGEPVHGAIVSIDNIGLADTTDERGMYRIRSVPPGMRKVSVRRVGFADRNLLVLFKVDIDLRKDLSLYATHVIPEDHLELHLACNGEVADLSPQAHHMGLPKKNIVKYVADRFGRPNHAIKMAGSYGFTTLDGQQAEFKAKTMGAWINVSSISRSRTLFVFGRHVSTRNDGCTVALTPTQFEVYYCTNGQFEGSSIELPKSFPFGEWVWVGFAVDEYGSGYVTLNGTVVKAFNVRPNNTASDQQIVVGDIWSNYTSTSLNGDIDQIVVYSKFLSLPELTAIMNMKE